MKKTVIFLLAFLIAAASALPAFAETETVRSTPKIIVEGCEVRGELCGGKRAVLIITLKNTNRSESVKNMTAVFSAEGGDILPQKTNTVYISYLRRAGSFEWELPVTVKKDAPEGLVQAAVTCEYETESGEPCTSSGSFTLSTAAVPTTVKATKKPAVTEKKDASVPRLMVTAFEVEGGFITPDKSGEITVTFKNTSASKYVKNIRLSIAEESGEIRARGAGTAYVKSIAPGGTFNWKEEISASRSAAEGEHRLGVSMEYEDADGNPYSAADTVRVSIRQTSRFEVSGAQLPVKAVQDETVSVSVKIMNTGKSKLSNCTVTAEVEGFLCGGALLVGEIEPGETGTGTLNIRAKKDFEGETAGTLTVSAENESGEITEKSFELRTLVEKKAEAAINENADEKKYPLWWAFLLGGAVLGAGAAAAVTAAFYSAKERKKDEQML